MPKLIEGIRYTLADIDHSRLASFGIDSYKGFLVERLTKIENEMYLKLFGLLYPGKNVKWLMDNAYEINAKYGFVFKKTTENGIVRLSLNYVEKFN